MSELKRCPFCGGEAKLTQYYPHMTRRIKTRIYCVNCRANSGDWGLKNKAIKAWNTRKPIDRIVERLKQKKTDAFERLFDGGSRGIGFCEAIGIVKEEGEIK